MNRPQPEDEIAAALELRKTLHSRFPDLGTASERAHRFIVRPEETDESMNRGMDYLALPRDQVYSLVHKYFNELEASKTTEFCICAWAGHPDDAHLPVGHPKRRLRKVDEHDYCPMHTHIGRVIGFFDWLFKQDGPTAFHGFPGDPSYVDRLAELDAQARIIKEIPAPPPPTLSERITNAGPYGRFTRADGTEIVVLRGPNGTVMCTDSVDDQECRTVLRPNGECPNAERHDITEPDY